MTRFMKELSKIKHHHWYGCCLLLLGCGAYDYGADVTARLLVEGIVGSVTQGKLVRLPATTDGCLLARSNWEDLFHRVLLLAVERGDWFRPYHFVLHS